MTHLKESPLLRFHGLDTLRAAAILVVVLYHLRIGGLLPEILIPAASVGWIGVDLFFVLSGFLIGSQLLKPYVDGAPPSLRDFYARRAYRILPAYFTVLCLYLLFPLWREAPGPYAPWQYITFTWNLLLLNYPESRAFSHVWSLCVEEHFYLLLPLLVLAFMRRPTVWKTLALIAFIVLGGIALRAWLLGHVVLAPGVPDDTQGQLMMKYLYYPTYSRLDGLVVGVSLAIARTFRAAWFSRISHYGNLLFACGLAAVLWALRLCDFGFPDPDLRASILFAFPILSIGFGLLVTSAVSGRGILTRRVPGAKALATLAFSLYLTHKSVAHATHQLLPSVTEKTDWRSTCIYFAVCIAFAALLYFAVERPFMRLRLRRAKRRMAGLVEREARLDPAI
ncbi:peptidoglycan/LPS O-acetylase OafA/YrhL [Granulicella aggregans]|uniref:Peptidoglycan/LPS O-acetylase OafA/YrhL n=1 Tax=Granulicella aggregans TaxID=474949 RepID=A0A7W8E6F9_9BACT|nr:acyltransferase [Granulicella aggregans]MBB5060274.1 peptidoglycan/LPS O-acetylase OafA/YrhL [Granulicella aggregans]